MLMKHNVNNDDTKDSPILSLGVNLSRVDLFIERILGEVLHAQFKDPIKTELNKVYCFASLAFFSTLAIVQKMKQLLKG